MLSSKWHWRKNEDYCSSISAANPNLRAFLDMLGGFFDNRSESEHHTHVREGPVNRGEHVLSDHAFWVLEIFLKQQLRRKEV